MLTCDMRTMQVLFHPREGGTFRELRVISMAGTLGIIREEQRKLRPTWKRYYSRHWEKHLARQKHSRATQWARVRTYHHQHERPRTMRRGASRGAARTYREVASCST